MRVKANASDFAIGGVLSIKYEDKKWRLVVYILKLLSEAERNYEIHNKKYQSLLDVQRYGSISQKAPRVSLKFGPIIKT